MLLPLHNQTHVYRDVGIFLDAGQLILLGTVTYALLKYVRLVSQVRSIGLFWLDSLERQQGTARSPMPLTSTESSLSEPPDAPLP